MTPAFYPCMCSNKYTEAGTQDGGTDGQLWMAARRWDGMPSSTSCFSRQVYAFVMVRKGGKTMSGRMLEYIGWRQIVMTLRKPANAKGHFLQVQEDADLDLIPVWIFLPCLSCEFEVLGSQLCLACDWVVSRGGEWKVQAGHPEISSCL